jgi:hypothetical protein
MVAATVNPGVTDRATVDFDHLAAGDGCIFEIIHHEPIQPRLQGTVRGKPLKRKPSTSLDDAERQALRSGWKERWKTYGFMGYYVPIVCAASAVVTAIFAANPAMTLWLTRVNLGIYDTLGVKVPGSPSADELYEFTAGYWLFLVGLAVIMTLLSLLVIQRKLRQKVPRSVLREEAPFVDEKAGVPGSA